MPIYYLGESISGSICGVDNSMKSIVGGRKTRKKKTKKSRKYKHYTYGIRKKQKSYKYI